MKRVSTDVVAARPSTLKTNSGCTIPSSTVPNKSKRHNTKRRPGRQGTKAGTSKKVKTGWHGSGFGLCHPLSVPYDTKQAGLLWPTLIRCNQEVPCRPPKTRPTMARQIKRLAIRKLELVHAPRHRGN